MNSIIKHNQTIYKVNGETFLNERDALQYEAYLHGMQVVSSLVDHRIGLFPSDDLSALVKILSENGYRISSQKESLGG